MLEILYDAVYYDLDVARSSEEKEEMLDEIAILYFYGVNVCFVGVQQIDE